MGDCVYCHGRKGKRACPALLGSICTRCCGEHRQREIACPSDCPHLPAPTDSSETINRLQARLFEFALRDERVTAESATEAFFVGKRELAEWEQPMFLGYVVYAHEDDKGERSIERFGRLHGATLERDEVDVLESLARAWPSLYEVVSVELDKGLVVRDVIGGGEHRIRERSATHSLHPGDHVLAWLMELHGVTMFTGALASVPPAHVEVVEDTLRSGVEKARTRDPKAPLRTLVRRSMGAAQIALREAIRNWKPPKVKTREGYEVGFHRAVYDILDAGAVRARLAAMPELEEERRGRYAWLSGESVLDDPSLGVSQRILGSVEVKAKKLTLECYSEEHLARGKKLLGRELRGFVEHRFDEGERLEDRLKRDR